eukprot:m.134036 g.134036  ORF g.134036 m.134036 type:complete len:573 (+) comp29715_c0_seq1:24-1742(+)
MALNMIFCIVLLLNTAVADIPNSKVQIDMVQNNPGDAVAWQQSKYIDPRSLVDLGYTAQCSTGEVSGTQAVDFHTTGQDFFPQGSVGRMWLDAYIIGVGRFVNRAKQAGLKAYFFVDMLVFPNAVLKAYPGALRNGKIEWNDVTRKLTQTLINETFTSFPDCDGFIVRTGETYTYDTPYHTGNSPSNGTNALWTDFISFLRDEVCVKHDRDLFFRSWDNWASSASVYTAISDPITPHSKLYFSIKHSAGDFVRPAQWNPQLGVGKHAQIVEVELQREYESKGALPNYVMQGVINGFPEMNPPIGLKSIIGSEQLKGLWTWTRGGGWWGPYIHGNEIWIDLHAHVLSKWWGASGSITETEAFVEVCPTLFDGCGTECCAALHNITLMAAEAVFRGQWGATLGASPGIWMRDDRIGGFSRVNGHFKSLGDDSSKWAETVALRQQAVGFWNEIQATFRATIAPEMTDPTLVDVVDASIQYGLGLYTIVEAGWRGMAIGYRKNNKMSFSQANLTQAIADYDNAWGAYKAFGISELYAASLYHDYYLCLGDDCDNAFVSDGKDPGMGDSINSLRPTK